MNASAALSESGTGRYVAVLFGIKWNEIHQGSNPGRVTTSRPRERRPPRQLEGFFVPSRGPGRRAMKLVSSTIR